MTIYAYIFNRAYFPFRIKALHYFKSYKRGLQIAYLLSLTGLDNFKTFCLIVECILQKFLHIISLIGPIS